MLSSSDTQQVSLEQFQTRTLHSNTEPAWALLQAERKGGLGELTVQKPLVTGGNQEPVQFICMPGAVSVVQVQGSRARGSVW